MLKRTVFSFLCVFAACAAAPAAISAAAAKSAPGAAVSAPFSLSPFDDATSPLSPSLTETSDERTGAHWTPALFLNTEEEGLCALSLEEGEPLSYLPPLKILPEEISAESRWIPFCSAETAERARNDLRASSQTAGGAGVIFAVTGVYAGLCFLAIPFLPKKKSARQKTWKELGPLDALAAVCKPVSAAQDPVKRLFRDSDFLQGL